MRTIRKTVRRLGTVIIREDIRELATTHFGVLTKKSQEGIRT
jgi:hypothetical protein